METNTKTSQTGLYELGNYKCQDIARLAVWFYVQAQISACTIFNELTWSLTWHLRYPYRAAAAAVSSVTQGFDLNEQVFFWRHLKLHGRPVGLHYAASSVPVLTIYNLRGRKWVIEMQILVKILKNKQISHKKDISCRTVATKRIWTQKMLKYYDMKVAFIVKKNSMSTLNISQK